MKILILGASGNLGKYITNFLFINKYDVIAHLRNKKKNINFNEKIKLINFDINSNFSKLNFDFNSIDFIINCVAETKKVKLMNNSNILFLKIFLEKFTQLSKNKFTLIHFSTIGIYSKNDSKIISEESTPIPSNEYEKSKNEAEKIIKLYSKKFRNMSYYIFRLGIVYGPSIESNVLNGLQKISNKIFYFKLSNTYSPFIDIRDICQFIELSLQNKILINNSYNLTENYKLEDIIFSFRNKNKSKSIIIKLNKKIVYLFFLFFSTISYRINMQQFTFLSSEKQFNNKKISLYRKNLKKYNLINFILNARNHEK